MARAGLVALSCAAALAAPVPFLAWSTAASERKAPAMHTQHFDREALFSVVRADTPTQSLMKLTAVPAVRHVFVFDQFSSHDMSALATSSTPGVMTLMSQFSKTVSGAPGALSVPRADMAGTGSLTSEVATRLAADGCTVTLVADATQGALSRAAYMEIVSRPSSAPDAACAAYVVPLAGARAQAELAWVLRASAAGSVAATAGADQLFVVTSEPAGNGVEARMGPAAAVGQPRLLQTTTTTSTNSPIMITPEVVQGLIVGFILLFITIVGLQCTMNIRTPDVMHSTTLPAGKEY